MTDQKKSNKDRLREITENIETGIKELFEGDKYRQYLSTMSRFHRYSLNNTMLIYLQKPDATLVAGFNKWINQFERHVKKGEHGITIIAPTPFKKKIEEQKLDPDTKAPVPDKEGKIVTEEKEVEIPMFRPVKVFDVSQTDGKPLPQLASDLSGNVQQYEAFMEALRRTSPVPMAVVPLAGDTDGYFRLTDQRIAIREGMSEVQTVSAAVHEIAHSILHNTEKERLAAAAGTETKEPVKAKDRHTQEVEAESVSYAVCQYYGIQTGENSFGYIATWSEGKELAELKASLETINKTASSLITDIDRHFVEVCKERGIDLSAEQEQARQEQPAPEVAAETIASPDTQVTRPILGEEALFLVDDANYLHIQTCDEGYDYTIYEKESSREVDGGVLANPDISLLDTRKEIFLIHGMPGEAVKPVSLDLLEQLQDAQAVYESEMRPDTPEQALDEYPMPDEELTQADLEQTGYLGGDMRPLSREMAQEFLAQDFTVYAMTHEGAQMIFDEEDLVSQPTDMVFAMSREEWQKSSAFRDKLDDRQTHQQEREQAFLNHEGDCFAIYQLQHTDETRDYRFEGMESLQEHGLAVEHENYDLIYTAPLTVGGDTDTQLDKLYEKFNLDHPADYRGHSLSVSNIVAIRQDGTLSCHYVDSFGFTPVPDFIKPENYLKAAEISTEDDYGMIDGIINNGTKQPTVAELEQQARTGQPISLMDLADAVHRERQEKKKSVVEQLHSQSAQETKKTAPKRSAEREL